MTGFFAGGMRVGGGGPPPSGRVFLGAHRGVIGGNQVTGNGSGSQYGCAWGDVIAAGSYLELEVLSYEPENRVGIWPIDSLPPSDPGEWGALGQNIAEAFGINGDGPWSNHAFYNGDWITTDTPDTSLDPVRRWGFALGTSRRLWVRQVWVGGATAWYGGGDPVAGTTPTVTFAGSATLRPAASFHPGDSGRIIAPASHYRPAPSGYTAS